MNRVRSATQSGIPVCNPTTTPGILKGLREPVDRNRIVPEPAVTPTTTKRASRATVLVFTIASFLGSGLLFMVQPMVARMLLPLAGGTPSLWNTSMVFFQLALLGGYAFAHVSTRRLGLRRHPVVQIGLLGLPLLVLPVAVDDGWRLPAETPPMVWVFAVLALVVGLPFFALSTSSPTLQRWFAATDHPAAGDPYFLYAAGNAGSVIALLSYPVLVEPTLSLGAQTRLWTALYVLFLGSSMAAAVLTRRSPVPSAPAGSPELSEPIAPARRAAWVLWSFVPSALMLGVTRHISTDVASVPLLWIVPLFLYLLTFIIAFGRRSARRVTVATVMVRYGIVPLAFTFVFRDWNLGLQMAIHLGWFFFAALLGHSRLSEDRPAPDRLTEFYLWISVGGVAGGVFAALLAPVVFESILEYPIAIALALLLPKRSRALISVPERTAVGVTAVLLAAAWLAKGQGLTTLALLFVVIALVNGAVSFRRALPMAATVAFTVLVVLVFVPSGLRAQERSFFGVYRVQEGATGTIELASGTTVHGSQLAGTAGPSPAATSYYHAAGPIGQAITSGRPGRVGIVGLGVGGLAAYAGPGDRYTFFEIDPTVVDIARDPRYFTFLSEAQAEINIVLGDGRLSLLDSDERFDLLVIDAFNSDAIPIHLLTVEAIETYFDRLAPGGVLAIHISNRHFTLEPVLGRIQSHLGLAGLVQFFSPSEADRGSGALPSHWVVLAREPASLAHLDGPWKELVDDGPLWTDDYSNILGVIDL